jgi:hypothetical protein
MDGHPECLAFGAIISFLVSMLKRIPAVKAHPKIVAALLSMAAVAVVSAMGPDQGNQWAIVLRCIAETFAVAVATHETVVQPVKNKIEATDPFDPDK